jgi:hypothetical protein
MVPKDHPGIAARQFQMVKRDCEVQNSLADYKDLTTVLSSFRASIICQINKTGKEPVGFESSFFGPYIHF